MDPTQSQEPMDPHEPHKNHGQHEFVDETVKIGGKHLKKRTVFYIAATCLALLLFAIAIHEQLSAVIKYVFSILSPVTIGLVIAYLCDPIMEFFEYRILRRMHNGSLKRGLSLVLTVAVAFGVVCVVGSMMIPQLVESINDLITDYETYLNGLLNWIQNGLNTMTENLPFEVVDISDINKLTDFVNEMYGSAEEFLFRILGELQQFVTEGNLVEKSWSVLITLFNSFKNAILGVFIAFYLLASKEKRVAQIRKIRKALFSEKTNSKLDDFINLTDKSFGGFIYGKLLDSLVIGLLTFVMLSIFEVSPYNMLIATFIGLTNVIPVFGPFIGAIPTFFVVLISNPDKAFLFLVLVLIIQQLDGNVIGPKILGDNTGISSLCVIIAIAVCSAMWGILGMLIGVPIFAVIIEIIKRYLDRRLTAKGEPTDTMAYYSSDAVGNAEKDLYYEHSSLRYNYEHSKVKPMVEKIRNGFLNHLGRQSHDDATPPNTNSETETNSDTAPPH